jgi:uncharacterized protein (TIGR00375 family)
VTAENSHLVFADLHIHGKYSRATSENMDIPSIIHYAQIKGLNLLGTGDFTHPMWKTELRKHLKETQHDGLYASKDNPQILFMATTEVCTIFDYQGMTKKIHHLIFCPSFEVADQVSDRLSRYGDLDADGRPTLQVSAPELVEVVMELSKDNMVVPAHVWTPWFSLFGSIYGFDRVEDCYQDTTRHISALETGLSSDPPMNWRLSALDRFALISNSDAHSPYPYRMGREANVFQLDRVTFGELVEVIRTRDTRRFLFTIEVDPAYGKYHWSGHRRCNLSVPASESKRLGGVCPVCRKKLTRGVEERVETLADRPIGYKPQGAVGFKHLMPLQETIAAVMNVDSEASTVVWKEYSSLVGRLGNEYNVLLGSEDELAKATDPKIAEVIVRTRNDEVVVIPGYDGVYGRLDLAAVRKDASAEHTKHSSGQSNLFDFALD